MTHAIEIHQLTRRFGDFTALDRLTLHVPEGAIYGYLGLNGAGKSTTIKILTTLLAPTQGRARVAGHDVVEEPHAVRARIGLVGDEGGESRPSWTAREYVGWFARVRGLPSARSEIERVLDLVDLDPRWRGRVIGNYSTGMRRRVELARALLGEPRVLFLDEPTRGLDLPAKRDMWDLFGALAREERVTVFLSSHEASEIQALCKDISVIAHGRLTYSGPSRALGSEPRAFEDALVRLLKPTPARAPSETSSAPPR